jgi:hypothetical protein
LLVVYELLFLNKKYEDLNIFFVYVLTKPLCGRAAEITPYIDKSVYVLHLLSPMLRMGMALGGVGLSNEMGRVGSDMFRLQEKPQ